VAPHQAIGFSPHFLFLGEATLPIDCVIGVMDIPNMENLDEYAQDHLRTLDEAYKHAMSSMQMKTSKRKYRKDKGVKYEKLKLHLRRMDLIRTCN